jgi:hypothetical protein
MATPIDDLPLSRAHIAYPLGKEHIYGFCTNAYDDDTYDEYMPIVRLFGTPLVVVSDKDYQGDTRVLLRSDTHYGFVVIGFGTCSGCDALQACTTFEDVDRLIDEIESDIRWFDTLAEAQTYVALDSLRALSFYYHSTEWTDFKQKVLALSDAPA